MFIVDELMLDVFYSNFFIVYLVYFYYLEVYFVFKFCEVECVVDYVEFIVLFWILFLD